MDTVFSSIKNVLTAIELAVYLEEKACDIYKNIETETDNEDMKKLFSFLEKEEKSHHKKFIRLLEKAGGKPFLSGEPVGEYGMFLELLSSDILKALKPDKNMNVDDAVKMALRFEKDTLLVFNEIKSLFKDGQADVLDAICHEEKNHIMKLIEFKNNL